MTNFKGNLPNHSTETPVVPSPELSEEDGDSDDKQRHPRAHFVAVTAIKFWRCFRVVVRRNHRETIFDEFHFGLSSDIDEAAEKGVWPSLGCAALGTMQVGWFLIYYYRKQFLD